MFAEADYFGDETIGSKEGYLDGLKRYISSIFDRESAINSIYIEDRKITVEVDRSKKRTLAKKIEEVAMGFIPINGIGYYPVDSIRVRGVKF